MTDLLTDERTFTRSNGTVFARVYERLTKASRRRADPRVGYGWEEMSYRAGVKDALEALRGELNA